MKKVKLDVNERLLVINVLAEVKGNLAVIKRAMDIMEVVEIKEAERKKLGLKAKNNLLMWNSKKDKEEEFELEDEDFKYLKEIINNKQDYPVDKRIINFIEKINNVT